MMNDKEFVELYLNADEECRNLVYELLAHPDKLDEMQPRIDNYIQSRTTRQA